MQELLEVVPEVVHRCYLRESCAGRVAPRARRTRLRRSALGGAQAVGLGGVGVDGSSGRRGCGRSDRRRARGRCRSPASPSPGATTGHAPSSGSTQAVPVAGRPERAAPAARARSGGSASARCRVGPRDRTRRRRERLGLARRRRRCRACGRRGMRQTAYASPASSADDDATTQELQHRGSLAHRAPGRSLTSARPTWQTGAVL